MKTTIEISGPVLARAKRVARKQKTTLRVLVEEGLDLAVTKRTKPSQAKMVLPTFASGIKDEFKDWKWEKIRDLIYEGHGT